jgi:rubrerythrin
MSSITGTKTEKNLLAAFAGESQARNRYTYAASVAKKEGFNQIATIFEETAENEKMHAKSFFGFLEGGMAEITAAYPAGSIGTTAENLKAAATGEHEEYTILYPEFARIAQEEGFPKVAALFKGIAKIENHHEQQYLALLKMVENGTFFSRPEPVQWICQKCGHIHQGTDAPKICAVCQHPQSHFHILNAIH